MDHLDRKSLQAFSMKTDGRCSSGFPEGSRQMGNFPPNWLENLPDNTLLFLGPQGRPVKENAGGSPCQAVPGEQGPILRLMCLNNVRLPCPSSKAQLFSGSFHDTWHRAEYTERAQ